MNNDQHAINSTLPDDFDGVFRFTNFSESDFKARWGGIEYSFPAETTTPIIIPNASPEEVQSIRKKFAKELAVQEFYKTPKFVGMNTIAPGGVPALYTDSDLEPLIQRCLEPLPVGRATATPLPKEDENLMLRKDNRGKTVTKVIEDGDSLVGDGQVVA